MTTPAGQGGRAEDFDVVTIRDDAAEGNGPLCLRVPLPWTIRRAREYLDAIWDLWVAVAALIQAIRLQRWGGCHLAQAPPRWRR
jgi:hypothetical protein